MVRMEIHGGDAKEVLIELRAMAAALSPAPESPVSGNDSPVSNGPRRGRKTAQAARQDTAAPAPADKTSETVPTAPGTAAPSNVIPAAPSAPAAPVSAPVAAAPAAPVSSAAMPVQAPAAPAQPITLDMISNAGSALIDQGKMDLVMQLLSKYGVQAITLLPPAMYPAFAADLQALGDQM